MLLISFNALADCSIPTEINKGSPSPCDGYVMDSNTEQKIRTAITYKDLMITNLTQQNSLQADIMRINSEQIKTYQDELVADTKQTDLQKILYFGLGVVVTGVTAYATINALK